MKRFLIVLLSVVFTIAVGVSCAGKTETGAMAPALKDGVYEAQTRKDSEGYFVKGVMCVEKGNIVSLDWEIRDGSRNDKLFDNTYGPEVYEGNPTYQQQCRDNLAGMPSFAPRLIETQDPAKVDAVTGATWAQNEFQFIVAELIKKAKG
jgi:major membrane immunogen (membrane-anchored lipoprotein)